MPRVSIGLPVYNGEKYLEETLNSILTQTYTDFELIISDNASTDNTEDICYTYASKDKRIRYFRKTINIGAAQNYNYVFKISRGQYFKWAAHDDILLPNFLKYCVEVLDKNPEVVLCYPKTTLIDEYGQIITMDEDNLNLDSQDVVVRFFHSLSPMKLCHNPVFGLMRSNLLSKTRLIGRYLASDRCLVAELTLLGPFHEIPEYLFIRRKHSQNIGISKKHLNFYDPSLKVTFVLPEWRVFLEHLISVKNTPIKFTKKFRLTLAVLHWAALRRLRLWYEITNTVKHFMFKISPAQFVLKLVQLKNRK